MNRYELVRELGRGGMAEVWLARDADTGRVCALKRLRLDKNEANRESRLVLFEGEYHMLAQLRHPHVVRVEDYGLADGEPYYTMELLEGGDLHGRGAMAWRELSPVLCDVASALALVHSRRFVHRDVTPRNVHFGSDGTARLIDFGALAPMGVCREVIGTPPFVPPEAINGQPLDGRSDLFALGALAYWALCGRHAYPARSFPELRDRWRSRPADIAALVPELPPALGALIMSLVSLDQAARPASAAELYDRVCAIAELPRRDDLALGQAFLTAPKLVARDASLAVVRRHVRDARRGGGSALLVEGAPGVGRTRFLERCVLESKLTGALVLQGFATDADRGEYGLLQALAEQIIAAAPEQALRCGEAAGPWIAHALPALAQRLGVLPAPEPDDLRRRQRVHEALLRWFQDAAKRRPVVIAIDDLHVLDEPSLAVIVGLVHACPRLPLNLIASMPAHTARGEANALRAFAGAATRIALVPLAQADFTELVSSLFADAPGATALAEYLHRVCDGMPGACMAFAQHLVDRKLVRHELAGWTLPQSLYDLELPSGVRALHERKLDALSEDTRELAETLALADRPLPLERYTELTSHQDSGRMHAAVQALLSAGILARGARGHSFADAGLLALLRERMAPERRRSAHLRLAGVAERARAEPMELAWHLLQAGEHARAAELALEVWRHNGDDPGALEIAWVPHLAETLEPLIAYSEREGHSPLQVFTLREFLMVSTMWTRPGYALGVGSALQARLRVDLGLVYWNEVAGESALDKLTACLQRALSLHEAAPQALQGLHPLAALQHLGRHVLYATQCASAAYRVGHVRELVSLIEPFAALAPVLDLIHQVARSALAGMTGATEESQAGLEYVLVRLEQPDLGLPENHRRLFRLSVLFGLGMISVKWRDPRVLQWADELETHVLHESNAWRLRKLYHLHEPDVVRASACQERIDTLSLLERRELPGTVAFMELWTAAAYADFRALRRALTVCEVLTERYSEYLPMLQLGQGFHQLLGGNPEAAVRSLRAAVSAFEANGDMFRLAIAQDALALALIDLERSEEARAMLLRRSERPDVWLSSVMSASILALCEAELGEPERALTRATGAAEALDTQKLQGPYRAIVLGYAARAALVARNGEAFELYASALAGMCQGDRCPSLRALHAAIVKKAQRRDLALREPRTFATPRPADTHVATQHALALREALDRCSSPQQRADCALAALVDAARAKLGFLYRIDSPTAFALLAATPGARPPSDVDDSLRARIGSWWFASDQLTVGGDSTPDAASVEELSGIFSSPTGECYQLIMLRTPAADQPVAAVVVQIEAGHPATIAFELIEGLAHALWLTGDATLYRPVTT